MNDLNNLFEKTEISQEDFSSHVDKTFKEMSEILKEKNRMYGGASMDMGQVGVIVHLNDKMNRYKKLVNLRFSGDEESASFESLEDTLRDIIGYATIGLAILEAQEPEKGSPLKMPLGGEDYDVREFEHPFGYDKDVDN